MIISTQNYRRILKATAQFTAIIPPQIRLLLAKMLIHPGLETLFDPNSIKNYSKLKYKPYLKKLRWMMAR